MRPHDPIKAWTEAMRNMETADLKRLVRVVTGELTRRRREHKVKTFTLKTALESCAASHTES